MTGPSLEEEFKDVKFPSMRGDVFTLYYRLASREHKLVFDREVRANATKYLHCYVSLIQENFPSLKLELQPKTDGHVGFIGELLLSQQCVDAYGFRPVNNSDEEVYFVPVQQALGNSNLTHLNGANDLHWRSSACSFREGIDITTEVVDGELLPQVRQLIERGGLNESNNPDLLTELIIETTSHHKHIFKRLFASDQRTVLYPLKLNDVLDCLLREKLARHYQNEIVERKRQNGEIRETWNGTSVSYSYSSTTADAEAVRQNVERALALGDLPNFTTRYLDLDDLETSLSTAVNALLRNRKEITSPLFKQVGLVHGNPVSTEDLKVYLGNLYSAFLSNYKALIETNFPTLRTHFKLYSEFPVSVFLVVGAPDNRDRYTSTTPMWIYFSKSELGRNVVQIVEKVEWNRAEGGLNFTIGGAVHEGISMIGTSVENLFTSSRGLEYDRFRGMTLRMLVYSTLRQELSAVEDAYRKQVKMK